MPATKCHVPSTVPPLSAAGRLQTHPDSRNADMAGDGAAAAGVIRVPREKEMARLRPERLPRLRAGPTSLAASPWTSTGCASATNTRPAEVVRPAAVHGWTASSPATS
jgi:hypothetical protein